MATEPRARNPMKQVRHPRAAKFVELRLYDDLGSFADLEARIAALPTEKDRGDAFEVFAEAYLATQKIHQADEVWPETSAPIAVMRQLALPDIDQGVDGVLKQLDGALAAYQVKFRTGRPTLAWRDLSTFIGLADRVSHRILFTNCDEVAEVLNERRNFICVRGADLDSLTPDDLAAIATWLRGDGFNPVHKSPREHQQNALTDLDRGLASNDRATAVMACGSGKTLVALWLAERMGAKRILVLVPSLSLIRQTLHEWLKETRWDAPRFLACCSDPSVTSGVDDAIVVRPSDLDFPVTTDASEVRDFLKADDGQVRVVFSTYQSAQVVGEAIKGLPGFELGAFDEAHKTAGRTELKFAFALEDKNIPIAKRVFMTATPRHYDVRKQDKEGDAALVYSMDEPKAYGPIVHTLTFTEAVRRGIICDCKIIISVVTSDMLDEELLRRGDVIVEGDAVRARTVANQVALQKACEAHDLKKLFTFHSTVKSAADFTGAASSSVRAHLPGYEALHVSGEMPTARREKVMQAFREADRAVLSNARCLTEGVDVPAVDLVAFLSPRKSKVDIVQAAGRAMRKAEGKQTGYVLLPLFLETAKGETIEEALERTDFAEAWDVIQALREQDEVLADIIRQMREERGQRGGFDDARLRERIEVLGPQLSLDLIREAVAARVIERFGATWDEMLGQLRAFKAKHGHCRVVRDHAEHPKLASWLNLQRAQQRNGALHPERTAKLEQLGVEWAPLEAMWSQMYEALQSFKAHHGHCRVPDEWMENQSLGKWVGLQRRTFAQGKLPPDRIALLDVIGFDWEPFEALWEVQFSKLVRFKEEQGHCNVPQVWPQDQRFGSWVSTQRLQYKKGDYPSERKARLDAVGFCWTPLEAAWEQQFLSLAKFKERTGHCNVPASWPEDQLLARWVNKQREVNRRGKYRPERKVRMDAIGFLWQPIDDFWEEQFSKLLRFKDTHGHCNVPSTWEEDRSLSRWVITQRTLYKERRVPPENKARLDALGFDWDPFASAWDEQFAALALFKEMHGHCVVSQSRGSKDRLASWVNAQRLAFRKERLSAERKSRLDALGFVWEPLDASWEEQCSALARFKSENGHCKVPAEWDRDKGLATWMNHQRTLARNGELSPDRIGRLDALGFI